MWKERKKKNTLAEFFISPLFLFLALIALLAAIYFPLYKNIISRHQIDRDIAQLQEEIKSLEVGNQDFKKMLVYLESDQFVEAEARLNFGFKKIGEEVVVIKEEGADQEAINDESQNKIKISNPLKWLRYFLVKE